jgi:hypothetical protein
MSSAKDRLRKYRRRKLRAWRLGQRKKAVRLSILYWRYHFQVYGDHQRLWMME